MAAGTAFDGTAVVQNDGAAMHVRNLKIEGVTPNNCVAIFNGVAFINAGGSIKNVTLNYIGQTTGCQSGHRLEQQQERDRRARQRRCEDHGNTVTGSGPISYIAQNGIVVLGTLAKAQVEGNTVSGNWYSPDPEVATGILAYGGGIITIDRKNTLSGNEVVILSTIDSTFSGKKYTPAP